MNYAVCNFFANVLAMYKLQSRLLGNDTWCEDNPSKLANLWGLWQWCGDWKVLWSHITARVFSGMVNSQRRCRRCLRCLLERLVPTQPPSKATYYL